MLHDRDLSSSLLRLWSTTFYLHWCLTTQSRIMASLIRITEGNRGGRMFILQEGGPTPL